MSGHDIPLDDSEVDSKFAALVDVFGDEPAPSREQLWFRPVEHGAVAVDLPAEWLPFLNQILVDLVERLGEDGLMTARLYPLAHPDDLEAQAAYADATRDRIRDGRVAGCMTMLATLGAAVLDAAAVDAWVRTLNALRVVLARDVTDDGQLAVFCESGSEGSELFIFASVLLDDLTGALFG